MKSILRRGLGMALVLASALPTVSATAAEPSLTGTWTLTAADRLYPDGTRARDYGEHPKGRLIIDGQGRYSLQIFNGDRLRVASGDKATATPAELASAATGSSTHYGTVAVDEAAHLLVFRIEGASLANWDGTEQRRKYVLVGDRLSYQVPTPRADGSVPISEWRRERYGYAASIQLLPRAMGEVAAKPRGGERGVWPLEIEQPKLEGAHGDAPLPAWRRRGG